MAFVVEDGTGLPTATAYIDITFIDGYHTDRNNTAWDDFDTLEKQAAIIRATDYIDKRFGKRFRGSRKTKDQALEWPRLSAFDSDGYLLDSINDVPRSLEKACAEYALRAALLGVLAPDPLQGTPAQNLESGSTSRVSKVIVGEVARTKEVVGPIEDETWYHVKSLEKGSKGVQSSLVNDFSLPEYPEADLWLEELIESSMSYRLARA